MGAAKLESVGRTENLRPPLKWAGGKRWLVPHLKETWAKHSMRRLVEPLCGGLAVTLGLMPERALLNDINPHTINFYKWLQKGLQIALPMENDERLFYEHRRRFNQLVIDGDGNSSDTASLFYYLNRTCYNGLCRFNSKGEFNVPFGRYNRICYKTSFAEYRPVFTRWSFDYKDFGQLELDDSDFIYADPPYDVQFTKYARDNFVWDDQVRLAEWLVRHKGPVILSNQATDRVVGLYKRLGFRMTFVEAPRLISCTGDRTHALEVLVTKGI